MRVPPLIKDFLAWRWAPCVALTAGSLLFVCLAVLLIPNQFDAARSADMVSAFDHPASGSRAIYSASLAQGATLTQNAIAQGVAEDATQARLRAQPILPSVPAPRGFSPVIERVDPPAPPPEAAPPAPPIPADAVPAPAPAPPDPDAPHREN